MGYTDDDANNEFRRFVNRDLASVVCGLVFGVGGAGYSALKVWHVAPLFRIINYMGGVIALGAAVLDAYFLMFGTLTAQRATFRMFIAIAYALVCINVTSYSITEAFATCEDAIDYLGQIYTRPEPTPERQVKFCAHVTNPYVAVCLGVAFSTVRLSPPVALLLSVLYVGLYYTGYAISDLPGESVRALIAKGLIYFSCIGASLALNVTRYSSLREQFVQSVTALVEAKRALRKQEEVETLLGAMVPESVLERMATGEPILDHTMFASVLYSDIVSFTHWSSSRSALHVAAMLQSLCVEFDRVAEMNGVEKIKTIGDAYWAVAGIPEPVHDHAVMLCEFAQAMIQIVRRESARNASWGVLRIRVGVDCGEVYGTVFGKDRLSYEVFGPAGQRAHLCEQHGNPMQVCIGAACLAAQGAVPGALPLTTISLSADAIERTEVEALDSAARGEGVDYQLYTLPATFPAMEVMEQSTTESTRNAAHSGSAGGGSMRDLSRRGSMISMGSVNSIRSEARNSFAHSMASPTRVARVHVTKDAAKHRDRFLKDRLEKQQQLAEGEAATLEDTERRYSQRRYTWVLMRFEDDEVEGQYAHFVSTHHRAIRTTTRAGLAALAVAVLVSFFIQGSQHVPGAASWTLLAVATLGALALPVLSHRGLLPDVPEALVTHAVALLLIVGCGLASGTGTALDDDSVAGNDLTYMHAALTPLLTFGVAAIPSAAVLLLNFVVVIVPIACLAFESITFTADVGFLLLSLFFAAFGAVISEKLLRQQFLEAHIMLHQQREQRARIREQQAVLSAILPPFIIPEVIEWLGTGFDPAKGIVRHVSPAVVAFLQLKGPAELATSAAVGSAAPTALLAPPLHTVPTQVPSPDALIPEVAPGQAPNIPFAESGDSELFNQSLKRFEDAADDGHADDDGISARHWLIGAHRRVDVVLKQEASVLIKIKTIGDLVLLAGPFAAEDAGFTSLGTTQHDSAHTKGGGEGAAGETTSAAPSPAKTEANAVGAIDNTVDDARQAADEALTIFARCSAVMKGRIAGGLHAGSFVGTVLGTSRLCFDIFGDGVNTASRVMSSCNSQLPADRRGTGVGVSEQFVKLYAGLAVDMQRSGQPSVGSPGAGSLQLQHEGSADGDADALMESLGESMSMSTRPMERRRSSAFVASSAATAKPLMDTKNAFASLAELPPGPLLPAIANDPASTMKRSALEYSLRAMSGTLPDEGAATRHTPGALDNPLDDMAASPEPSMRNGPRTSPSTFTRPIPAMPTAATAYQMSAKELSSQLEAQEEPDVLRSEGTCFSERHALAAKGKGTLYTRVVTMFPRRFSHRDSRSASASPQAAGPTFAFAVEESAESFHDGPPLLAQQTLAAEPSHHPTRARSRRGSLRRPSFIVRTSAAATPAEPELAA